MRQGKSGQLDGPYPARSDESAIIRGDQWPVNQAAPAVKYQAPPPLFPSSPDLFLFTIFVSPTIASTNNVINPRFVLLSPLAELIVPDTHFTSSIVS